MSAAEKSEAEIYALFGGQGTNEVRFQFIFLTPGGTSI